jgi:hypothetical protein
MYASKEHIARPTSATAEQTPVEQIVTALNAVAATRHGRVQSQQQRDRGNSRAADALRTYFDVATQSSTDGGSAPFWLSFVASGGLDALFSALSRLPSEDKPRALLTVLPLISLSQVNGEVENAVRDWMPRTPQYLTEAYLEVQLQPTASVGECLLSRSVARRASS